MTTAFVTTSYGPDFERFSRLHESVVRHSDLMHHVFVPQVDLDLFGPLTRSGRLRLTSTRQVLSPGILTTERLNRAAAKLPRSPSILRIAAVNAQRPWPPLRGWVVQQLVKLAAVQHVEADTLVFVDSDVQLIRPVSERTFRRDQSTRLYRVLGGIHEAMPRHCTWHRRARQLLGIQGPDPLPYDDFIGGITTMDAALVRRCTARVEELAGRPWQTVIGGCLDVSEYIVYGEYVMAFATPAERSFVSSRSLCHSHWQREPLDLSSARLFVDGIADDDVAVHLQSNAHTPPEIERYVRDAVRNVTR